MMPRIHKPLFAALVLSLSLCCFGAEGPAAPKAERAALKAKGDQVSTTEIMEALNSKDPAQHQAAVEAVRQRVQTRGLSELRSSWLRPMMVNKQYKEVADLALEGIIANPADTRSLEAVLAMRIDALLAMGQFEQALSESRSLFNVATMMGTSEAILTVAKCINAARPNDVAMFNTFREEQMAGAVAATTQPATTQPAVARCTVLEGIKIDAKPYEETLKNLYGEDVASLLVRGNLLLLSGRVAEAKTVLERLYSLSGADLAEASESLARVMKAEDGTIARANAWVLSIRLKKPAQ